MNRTTSTDAPEVRPVDRSADIQNGGSAVETVPPAACAGIFITPDGAWLREGSAEFFIALGDPEPDYDAPLFTIKNLGFICVRVVTASVVDITLHPRNVAPAALRSLQ